MSGGEEGTARRLGARGRLRTGYTTGACAAAAAKAALLTLLGRAPEVVDIGLPVGGRAAFAVARRELGPGWATCSVVKDAGDDPDVTHGAEICARVAWRGAPGLLLDRGPGVGVITKPGLELPPGEPAINPVPRRMLAAAVLEVLAAAGREGVAVEPVVGRRYRPASGAAGAEDAGVAGWVAETAPEAGVPEPRAARGLAVTVWCPDGEERARRTLNARLGILGGISILGTRGIVVPYSTAAFRASIARALDVARAVGVEVVVLTTGGRSEAFARRLLPHLPEEAFVQMGEFLGFALKAAARAGFRGVVVCGMVGKLSKAAAGQFHLHARSAEVDTGFLADVAASCGAGPDLVAAVAAANTARHAAELVRQGGLEGFFDRLCALAWERSRAFLAEAGAGRGLRIAYLLTDFEGRLMGSGGDPVAP